MNQLKANDIEVAHETEDASYKVVIVNTCGFIDKAKQESIDTILNFSEAKNNGLIDELVVTGCLSERYKEDLKKEIPEVDAFFGTRNLKELLAHFNADYKHELLGERMLTTPKHYAYLKISEGCNRACSFCSIPLMRGKHVSTPIEQLVKEAESLAKKGVKELILIAQELTFYGVDIYKKRALVDLLKALNQVEGIEWIRLHYAYPIGFQDEVVDAIASLPKVCHYLDIPLQHASDKMLKKMKRGVSKDHADKLIKQLRTKVPDIAIRTTMIVGFPGETEQDVQELEDWMKAVKFDRLGFFTYSHQDGTTAANLNDTLSEEEKEKRLDRLMEVQREISYEINEQKIGKTYKVLFDRVEGDFFVGRTQYDSPEVDNEVLVSTKNNYLRIGDFMNIRITEVSNYDLYGEIVEKN